MPVQYTADAERLIIRLHVRPKPVSYFTIGHELTHLLQRGGLALVPMDVLQEQAAKELGLPVQSARR